MSSPGEQQIHHFRAAAQLIGDRLGLLVLFACFRGTTRFVEIRRTPGTTRSCLSNRVQRLGEVDLFDQRTVSHGARRFQYLPSPEAEALHSVLEAMIEWHSRCRTAQRRDQHSYRKGRHHGWR